MGGKTSTTTSGVTIPPEVLARYNAVNAYAENVAQTPFQQYSTDPNAFVAPITPTQYAGIQNTNSAAGMAQPYFQAGTGFALAGSQPVNAQPLDISTYMNPYLQTVLGNTAARINQNNQQAMAGQTGNAINQGYFGGDRSGIAAAVLQGQQNLAAGQIYSGIASDAYNQALAAAQQQQGVNLAAAQANRQALQETGGALANLGATAQGTALAGAQAQLGAGQVEQQTEQAGKTALYNQFLQQQSYPFQVGQYLANIAEGTGALSGTTTTTTAPGGLLSDERAKEDMEPIGRGFDGANIYRFRYKGDPTTRIGMSAQEVERKHPEAIRDAGGGFKAVDYRAATDDAARRGFALAANDNEGRRARQAGGMSGWDLYPSGVNPMSISALLQAQEQMYGPYSQAGLYGGSSGGMPHGGSGYVPAPMQQNPTLMIAHPPSQDSGDGQLHKAAQLAGDVKEIGGDAAKAGKWLSQQTWSPTYSGPSTHMGSPSQVAPTSIPNPGLDDAVQSGIHNVDVNASDAASAAKDAAAAVDDTTQLADAGSDLASDAGSLGDLTDLFAARGGFIRAKRDSGGSLSLPSTDGDSNDKGGALSGFIGQLPDPWRSEAGFLESMPLPKALGLARGGFARFHRDMGGGFGPGSGGDLSSPQNDDPYHPQGPGLDIPDDNPHAKLDVAQPPKGGGGSGNQTMSDIMDVAKIAMMFAGAKRGGRIGRQAGGGMPDLDADLADRAMDESMASAGALTGPQGDGAPAASPVAPGPEGPVAGFAGAAQAAGALARHAGAAAAAAANGRQPTGFAGMMARIAQVEGGGHNPVSSAQDIYQITDPTFTGLFRQMFPQRAAGMSKADILALRATPEGHMLSSEMGPQLARNNMATLAQHGFQTTAPNVYLAHLLGPGGAMRVLGADPSTPLSHLLHADAIAENPRIMRGKSAGDLIGWAGSQMRYAKGGRVGFADGGDPKQELDPAGNPLLAPDDPRLNEANYSDADPTYFEAHATPTPLPHDTAAPQQQEGGFRGALQGAEQGIGHAMHDFGEAAGPVIKSGWDWFKQPEHFIPVLTGLADMLAAPTKYPLVAITQGIKGGAQAYQAQRQFGLEQQQTAQKGTEVGAYALQARTNAINTAIQNFEKQYHPYPPEKAGAPGRWQDSFGNIIDADEYGRRRQRAINDAISLGQSATGPGGGVGPMGSLSTQGGGAGPPAGSPPTNVPQVSGSPTPVLDGSQPPAPQPSSNGQQQPSSPSPPAGGPRVVGAHHPHPVDPNAPLKTRLAGGGFSGGPTISDYGISALPIEQNAPALRERAQWEANQYPGAAQADLATAASLEAGHTPVTGPDGQNPYVQRQLAIQQAEQQGKEGQSIIDQHNAEASNFFAPGGEYATTSTLANDLIRVFTNWDTEGTLRSAWSNMVANARGTPFEALISDADKQVQAAIQSGNKDAMRLAMSGAAGAMAHTIIQGAPAHGVEGSMKALPDPSLGPATRFDIVGQLAGALGQKHAKMNDWIADSRGGRIDAYHVADYDTSWGNAPENDIRGFNQRAYDQIPYFQGMSLQDKEMYPRHPTSVADVQHWPKATAQNPNLGVPFIIPSGKYKGRMAITDARVPAGFSLVR